MQLSGKSAIRTRWRDGNKTSLLYQFCGGDFGLRTGNIASQAITVAASAPDAAVEVRIWSEGHCDFALFAIPAAPPTTDAPGA